MKKAALAVAAAIVVSASIFSSLQIYSISHRVGVLEQAHAAPRAAASVPAAHPAPNPLGFSQSPRPLAVLVSASFDSALFQHSSTTFGVGRSQPVRREGRSAL